MNSQVAETLALSPIVIKTDLKKKIRKEEEISGEIREISTKIQRKMKSF